MVERKKRNDKIVNNIADLESLGIDRGEERTAYTMKERDYH